VQANRWWEGPCRLGRRFFVGGQKAASSRKGGAAGLPADWRGAWPRRLWGMYAVLAGRDHNCDPYTHKHGDHGWEAPSRCGSLRARAGKWSRRRLTCDVRVADGVSRDQDRRRLWTAGKDDQTVGTRVHKPPARRRGCSATGLSYLHPRTAYDVIASVVLVYKGIAGGLNRSRYGRWVWSCWITRRRPTGPHRRPATSRSPRLGGPETRRWPGRPSTRTTTSTTS